MARAARRSIDAARDRQRRGAALLVVGEGTLIRKAGRNRRLAMDAIGLALASLVPHTYRRTNGGGGDGLGSASNLLAALYD